jgi:predicted RNA-binding protein
MCLAEAFISENGKTELILEDVTSLKIDNEKVILGSIFGEQKEINARIKQIDFVHHNITLERINR